MHVADTVLPGLPRGQRSIRAIVFPLMAAPFEHQTVLPREVVTALEPRAGGVYLDATLGGGGHSALLLAASEPDGRVVGIDRDPAAREAAIRFLAPYGSRLTVVSGKMADAAAALTMCDIARVDGIIADLGISSPQVDDAARGLSFRSDGPLDMRMDPTQGITAWDMLRSLRAEDLANVLYEFGDERASRPIARAIKRAVDSGGMHTTRELASAVYSVLGPPRPGRGADPATRTFQAIRIAVNDELGQLSAFLAAAPDILADGAAIAVISFHSLEDRIVKRAFRETPTLGVITRKPIEAGEAELHANPRARSAKLRVARRLSRANHPGVDA